MKRKKHYSPSFAATEISNVFDRCGRFKSKCVPEKITDNLQHKLPEKLAKKTSEKPLEKLKVSDALVKALISLDVRSIFGVSGANIEHLHDAIHRLGAGKLKSVISKSEDGAAFMADCQARVHRRLGVCCSTSGGGMMNLIAGIAESYSDGVPVLALVGQPSSTLMGKGAFQDSSGIGQTVDSIQLWSAVTKYVGNISRPQDFWYHLTNAVQTALCDRPGPAVLLFPRDMFEKEVEPCPENWADEVQNFIRPAKIKTEIIRPLLAEIYRAKNPVMILGRGVRWCSNPQAAIEFARSMGLPTVATLAARGEFPNDDPLYLGMLGVAGHPSAHTYLKERADLLIVVGCDLKLMTRQPIQSVLAEKKIAVVNIDLDLIERIVSPDLTIEADAGVVFQRLLELLEEKHKLKEKYLEENRVPFQDYCLKIFQPQSAPPIDSNRQTSIVDSTVNHQLLWQSEAISIIQEFLPENGHLIYDAGNCAAATLHLTKVPPGSTSTIALGMGGMGYAIAGSIGAQLDSPTGTRTVVFAGDGAFLMTGLEIHTAVDLQLPILFILFNNNMHGMCATRQQLLFESRLECVRYAPVNIGTIARGFGSSDRLWVGTASTPNELREQLENYQTQLHLPGVLELKLLREELPPFTPFLSENTPTIPWGVRSRGDREQRRQPAGSRG